MNGISDIAVGHISITAERAKIVDFTCAIYQIDYGFMSRKPARLSSYRVRRLTVDLGPWFRIVCLTQLGLS